MVPMCIVDANFAVVPDYEKAGGLLYDSHQCIELHLTEGANLSAAGRDGEGQRDEGAMQLEKFVHCSIGCDGDAETKEPGTGRLTVDEDGEPVANDLMGAVIRENDNRIGGIGPLC